MTLIVGNIISEGFISGTTLNVVSSGTFGSVSATTISATTFYGNGSNLIGIPDTFVTGGTPNNSSKIYTFTNNTGGTFNVIGLTDITVTGGTYNNPTGTATLTNNTGGTFSITGFTTGTTTDTFVTGGTPNNSSKIYTFTNNTGGTFTVTGLTDIFISAGTANNSSKIYTFTNSTGGTFNVIGLTDINVTGGTLSTGGTLTITNNTGGTFSVSGFTTSSNAFVQGGNNFGTTAILGTKDNNSLQLITNNTPFATLDTGGNFSVLGNLVLSTTSTSLRDASNNSLVTSDGIIASFGSSNEATSIIGYTNSSIYDLGGITNNSNSYTWNNSSGSTTFLTLNSSLAKFFVPISANTITATTYFGNGSNLTGLADKFVTGATTNNSTKTYTFTNNSGGTFTVTGLTDITITGGTLSNTGVATFTNNTGGTFTVSGFITGDTYVTGGTPNNSSKIYTFTNNTGGTFTVTGLTDITITAGTANNSTKTYTFTNTTGGTFNVTGLTDIFVTGATTNNSSKLYTFNNSTGGTFNVTGLTDIFITGITNTNNLLTLTNSTGGTITTLINTLTGLTINGNLNITGSTTANTITATTVSASSLTIPSFTKGSVIFGGTGGLLSQNNADLFWDNTNNFFGIITNAPTNPLTVGALTTSSSAASASVAVSTISAANKGLVIQGVAAQSGNYFETQTSAGVLGIQVDSNTNFKLNIRGSGIYIKQGTNATFGRATLVAGTVTVNTGKATTTMEVFLTNRVSGGTLGILSIGTVTAGSSFVINSTGLLDTSSVSWWIVEPA